MTFIRFLEHIDDVADTATLWEYLTRHNDIDTILEWIKASRTIRSSTVAIRFPPFDPSLIHKCGQATRQVQRAIYREFLRYKHIIIVLRWGVNLGL